MSMTKRGERHIYVVMKVSGPNSNLHCVKTSLGEIEEMFGPLFKSQYSHLSLNRFSKVHIEVAYRYIDKHDNLRVIGEDYEIFKTVKGVTGMTYRLPFKTE